MVFSNALVALTAIAFSIITATASPVASVAQEADGLFARQATNVTACRYVVRAGALLDVNLPEEFRRVLTQSYMDSNYGDVGVSHDGWFEIATNGDDTWSWTWWPSLFDPVTLESWTTEASHQATEKLVGLTAESGNATWTIESAGCDPLDEDTSRARTSGRVPDRLVFTQNQSGEVKVNQLAERQDGRFPVCTFGMRPDPDSETTLIGVELQRELIISWALTLLDKHHSDLRSISSSRAMVLSHNSDGTWVLAIDIRLLDENSERMTVEETIALNEDLVGSYQPPFLGFPAVGWLIESATCVAPQ